MMSIRGCTLVRAATLMTLAASAMRAQEAVTISGHVSAADRPVQGASVRIQELRLSTTTSPEGRYTLIVPSSRVRGQTVTLTARHVRYNTVSIPISLVGGTLQRDFQLQPVGESQPRAAEAATISSEPVAAPSVSAAPSQAVVDSTAFDEIAGPTDFVSALAGRIAGLNVTSASTLGGSAPIVLRGYHTIVGNTQPLFVLDGIPLENSTFFTPGQPQGSGGFDYGSPVQAINPTDVASVSVLRGPAAAALYGGRAANGVVLITTKNGRGISGLEVSAHQQFTSESPIRRPSFQNSYGQGLGGQFEFFNGAGGGTNDAVAENWGPAFQGQPVAQASYVASGVADVRPWLPFPNNVDDYFESGRTLKTEVAAQGANDQLGFRLAANRRDTHGVVPSSGLTRQGIGIAASDQFTPVFSATARVQVGNDVGRDRPGTGFDTSNPVSDLTVMGRQVDIGALKAHVIDSAGAQPKQISWNYAGHNNPYFTANVNTNRDEQTRWIAGGSGTYAFAKKASATLRAGTDHYSESRDFDIAAGWMGGFPSYAGRGNFSNGGTQRQNIDASATDLELSVAGDLGGSASGSSSASNGGGAFTLSGGFGHHGTSFHVTSSGSDQGTATPVGRIATDYTTNSLFATANWAVNSYTSLAASARGEWYSILSSGHNSQLYPSVAGSIDLARAAGLKGSLNMARVHGGWSRAGGEVSGLVLWNVFAGSSTPTSTVTSSQSLGPEVTNSLELGASLGFFESRIGLDLTLYSEKTSDVIVGLPGSAAGSFVATNAASLTNSGIETSLSLVPVRIKSVDEWTIDATFAKNSNQVDALQGASSAALGPSLFGLAVQARPGYALGALVGHGYKRDAQTHALILEDGHPVPESQVRVLGVMAPDWSGGVSTTIHHGIVEVSALVDARMGGRIYSVTNLWGMTAGSFAETAYRPDTGLLIAGIDGATNKANTQHVTAEDYYHALRGIQEAWVYDASFVKFRDLRFTVAIPLRSLPVFTAQSLRASFIGRNLAMWAKAPNIDPETALSTSALQGIEMGQLPSVRSVGLQLSLTP